MPHSLYSGRARSYLIKNRIPFEERSTGHETFKAEVLPKGKLPTIPTLVTAEGEVIRDGGAIIEHFEAANGRHCQPQGPRQQVISALFDVIGTDGLLRPAMHYRWNFPEDNLEFVRYHFLHSQRDVPERAAKTEAMMNRMRHAACGHDLWCDRAEPKASGGLVPRVPRRAERSLGKLPLSSGLAPLHR